ncbi:MAG: heavy metal translocating P-type ATPase [Pseudomonadota bacterium]
MNATAQAELNFLPFVRTDPKDGHHQLNLMVENVRCGGCVAKIERELQREPGIEMARVNLTTRRLVIAWRGAPEQAARYVTHLLNLGFPARAYDPAALGEGTRQDERRLLIALAVAGFAAGNVMLLSVSVWAGHSYGMGEATRDLLHWISALITIPALAFAGRPFFTSAWSALRHGHTNMDVPISLGVVLAALVSLNETARGGEHAFFDSAIALVFFLLIGRYFECRARGRARSAAERLLALENRDVTILDSDGHTRTIPYEQLAVGDRVLVAPGDRVPVDGCVRSGRSDLDTSLVTGESVPRPAEHGTDVFAGMVNLSSALTIEARAVGETTLLAEIVRLMEAAEQRRAKFVALADRIARLYAPAVHSLAALTFLGWWLVVGAAWQAALLYAVAVLIITCPCALGLAVPVVQVIASGRLFRDGTLLKSATALERLETVDTVVFDKTGTLTRGRLTLQTPIDEEALRIASSIAAGSRHPLARALCDACPEPGRFSDVEEIPGMGLRAFDANGGEIRLGSRQFVGVEESDASDAELWLKRPGIEPLRFAFKDDVRPEAVDVIGWLQRHGFETELLSGDRTATVRAVAAGLGIGRASALMTPTEKAARLEDLRGARRHVLMVGDGLNDAPALAAADVSLSPSSAADITRNAADTVFQSSSLRPVVDLLTTGRWAGAIVRQNIALAIGYNILLVPLAVLGMVTPLIAAIAMSCSSLVVIGNALRLSWRRPVDLAGA